ncbi:hypothetical protein [Neobacillus sp. SuZ13]|uniref:hypothetical protein n=1 Tax=Neobacillus sp. SuZ13 TaxID=3047875 RepID=UPI0024BF6205|nr:hypothetical protein [Neobacillus sp. SuZ13]WHY64667.1 hypothetical protein QNH17_16195 [Neobacillus sp. SuZ13]
MASKFITLDRARKEIIRLQKYVNLVEAYKPINLEQEIILEYAKTSSIPEVSKNLNVSYEKVVEVISSKGKDELHKTMRSWYMYKTKNQRK